MSYVNVVLGNNVLFLLILLTANLKASSSELTRATGPSVCSKIPPEKQEKHNQLQPPEARANLWRCFAFKGTWVWGCVRERERRKWPHQRYLASLRPAGHRSFPMKKRLASRPIAADNEKLFRWAHEILRNAFYGQELSPSLFIDFGCAMEPHQNNRMITSGARRAISSPWGLILLDLLHLLSLFLRYEPREILKKQSLFSTWFDFTWYHFLLLGISNLIEFDAL